MDTGAAAHAPPGAFGRAALVQRLLAFVCVSIALHALIIVGYSPIGSGLRAQSGGNAPALHATLAPVAAGSAAGVAGGESESASTPQAVSAAGGGNPAGADIPLPEKWYTATELSVLAQPIVMPVLRYPEALAGSGVTARVRVKVFIDELGTVRKTEIVQPAPHLAFDAAAAEAWKDVRFSPALKDGHAVKSQKLLELDFEP